MLPVELFLRAAWRGRRAAPLYVVFFVTERCTASCGHCLLGQRECERDELSLDEIERWARNMPEFYFFLPTGGEPFLRADLPDIVRLFVNHAGVRNVGIPTNGSLTEDTVAAVERILSENPKIDFAVDVSLDAIGADHDVIRNTPGLFDKATATYRALDRIAGSNPRFNLNVAVTISRANQESAPGFLDYLVDELKVKNINHLLVRGDPRDPGTRDVDVKRYRAFNRKLDELEREGRLPGYGGYDAADGINAMKRVRRKTIEKTASTGKRQVSCRAGALGAVVRANGDVFPCEILDERIGGLRDMDFDFSIIWRSERAREVRRIIKKSECACTYECFMTLNVLFDPIATLQIAGEWAAQRARRAGGRLV